MKKFLVLLICICIVNGIYSEIVIYPVPNGLVYTRHNDDFTVQVRQNGGGWQDLFEYSVDVDNDNVQKVTMTQFDFSGTVEVKVRQNNGTLNQVHIRPSNLAIQYEIQGNSFTFKIEKPQKLSIETNGNTMNNLHLFANPLETIIPSENDPNVIYFGPGIHKPGDLPGDVFVIPSDKTVYLAGGAVLQGKILCNKVENVKICGRGIIDQAVRGVEITHSKNISIDGITVINPKHYSVYLGQSSNVSINNFKSFSFGSWTDGIDMMSCTDIDINDLFMRNSDDCIAIYAHRWNFYGNSKNISVKNSILWADVAHPINIGLHGNTKLEGDTIENISFKNIDILEQDEDDRNYQGTMSICSGDFNLVRNIMFDDVRVEDIQEGQLVNIRVVDNPKYSTGAGRSIENVSFKNISYNGYGVNPSVIEGYTQTNKVSNIVFENLRINGKLILNADSVNFCIGKFVDGLKFTK